LTHCQRRREQLDEDGVHGDGGTAGFEERNGTAAIITI